jgi:hypothetical protein
LIASLKKANFPLNPDDKLVYSTNLRVTLERELNARAEDMEIVLCRLFYPNCSYKQAVQFSLTIAGNFGLTPDEFMQKYRELRLVAGQRLKADSTASVTDRQISSESRSKSD